MFLDCFPYFNEVELLELRVNLLKNYVDGFVITEANRTHRGDLKEFSCLDTIRSLGLPEDLIKVIHVELPSAEEVVDPWIRERGQRDALASILTYLPESTVFLCSDCDEIPNPSKFTELISKLCLFPEEIFGLSMSMHYGRADLQLCSPTGEFFNWRCATVSTVKVLKNCGSISSIRAKEGRNFIGDRDAGWHLSWMGDASKRKLKLRSIAEHYLWDSEEVRKLCESFVPKEGNTDMLGRQDHLITSYPIEDLPEGAVKLERVKKYLFPDG